MAEPTASLKHWRERFGSAELIGSALVACAFAWRILWLSRQSPDEFHLLGEATNVARSLAVQHRVADAFGPGTGPTAHINPIVPWIGSLVYSVTGVDSVASQWILSVLAIMLCVGAALVYVAAAAVIGMPRWSRLAFLGLFALLPLYPKIETIEFRLWEGGLAILLAASLLLLIVRSDTDGVLSNRRMVAAAILTAFLFFISPPVGLGAYAAACLLLFERGTLGDFVKAGIIASVAAAAIIGPWTYRNWTVFHHVIPLRSNFGLEFALGTYSGAVTAKGEAETRHQRFDELHPLAQADAAKFLRDHGGEVAYSDQLGRATWAWVGAHRWDFAQIATRHLVEFYLPPSDFWAGGSRSTIIKQAVIWAISLIGLLGAVMAFAFWRDGSRYIALMALVPSLPYALVQPNLRYHYIVHLPLLLLAVAFAVWLYQLRLHLNRPHMAKAHTGLYQPD
jgi:hypothetical protein